MGLWSNVVTKPRQFWERGSHLAKAALGATVQEAERPSVAVNPAQLKGLQEQQRGAGKFTGVRRRSYMLLTELAEADLDTGAIISAFIGFVTTAEWDVVRELEAQQQELHRWAALEMSNLQPSSEAPGQPEMPLALGKQATPADRETPAEMPEREREGPATRSGAEPTRLEYESPVVGDEPIIDEETIDLISPRLTAIYEEAQAGAIPFEVAVRRMDVVFDQARALLQQRAAIHAAQVKRLFERPNDREERDWQTFIRHLLWDILVYDMGCIGLGKRKIPSDKEEQGEPDGLAEMWWVPGDEIMVMRTEQSQQIPKPPKPAWTRKRKGMLTAGYDTNHMINIRRKPKKDGYGLSPVECIVGQIVGSQRIDQTNLDEIKAAYMSSVIIRDPMISPENQAWLQQALNSQLLGGVPGDVATAGGLSEDAELWRLRGAAGSKATQASFHDKRDAVFAEKCRAYDLSPADIGFVQAKQALIGDKSSEIQWDISKARAIRNMLMLLVSVFNEHIIREFWGYTDCRFTFRELDVSDEQAEAEKDGMLIDKGVISRADAARKQNAAVKPGQEVVTVTTGAGVLPVESIQQYHQATMVRGQQAQEQEQPQALQTPEGQEEGAPGVPQGMRGEENVAYPQLANPFAIQQMQQAKEAERAGQTIQKRIAEVRKAVEADDGPRAAEKLNLLEHQANQHLARLTPDPDTQEVPGEFLADSVTMIDELRQAAQDITGGE